MTKPKILAVAKLDKSMVKTLSDYFDNYAVEGVVSVEVTDFGLWLINRNGSRQFLGSTTVLPERSQSKTPNGFH